MTHQSLSNQQEKCNRLPFNGPKDSQSKETCPLRILTTGDGSEAFARVGTES